MTAAGLHVWMAGQHSGTGWQVAGMLALALMCLPCVLPLWRSGSAGAARMLMSGSLIMVAVHAVVLLSSGGTGSGHQHGGVEASASTVGTGAPGAAFEMLAIIGWELGVAMLAATWLRRVRAAGQPFS